MHRRSAWLTGAAMLCLITGCGKKALTPSEGYVQVTGGRIWYRVVGTGKGTPLLILHGGPGVPSLYLESMAGLGSDRPVIFYDQLGAGRSDHVTDTSLFTIERFVEELATLRAALDLEEIHLYGHSWGTILAVESMLTKPEGVRSVILASPALSMPRWQEDARDLLAALPDSIRATIEHNEAAGTVESPEYQAATMQFYAQYLARRQPWSAEVESTFAQMNKTLYGFMNGPSEFTITGTLQNYDATDRLGRIGVPVLFTTGRYDEATPATVQYYHSLIPGSKLAILQSSGHLTMHDEPEEYRRILREFLAEVDQKKR